MTVTPSSASVTIAQSLRVAVVVAGASGHPVPSGTVTLDSGSYHAMQSLGSGSTTFSLAAGVLPTGVNTLTAVYAPDASSSGAYTTAAQSTVVTVTAAIGTVSPSITALPSADSTTTRTATRQNGLSEARGHFIYKPFIAIGARRGT